MSRLLPDPRLVSIGCSAGQKEEQEVESAEGWTAGQNPHFLRQAGWTNHRRRRQKKLMFCLLSCQQTRELSVQSTWGDYGAGYI